MTRREQNLEARGVQWILFLLQESAYVRFIICVALVWYKNCWRDIFWKKQNHIYGAIEKRNACSIHVLQKLSFYNTKIYVPKDLTHPGYWLFFTYIIVLLLHFREQSETSQNTKNDDMGCEVHGALVGVPCEFRWARRNGCPGGTRSQRRCWRRRERNYREVQKWGVDRAGPLRSNAAGKPSLIPVIRVSCRHLRWPLRRQLAKCLRSQLSLERLDASIQEHSTVRGSQQICQDRSCFKARARARLSHCRWQSWEASSRICVGRWHVHANQVSGVATRNRSPGVVQRWQAQGLERRRAPRFSDYLQSPRPFDTSIVFMVWNLREASQVLWYAFGGVRKNVLQWCYPSVLANLNKHPPTK